MQPLPGCILYRKSRQDWQRLFLCLGEHYEIQN
nr:MAG TPA: hypothetical protein [Caudoviricetes sp.]